MTKDGNGDEDATLLQEIHHNKLIEFLPVIIPLTLLTILGIVFNSFSIRFCSAQRRKSSTSIFIQFLGVVDLFVCILSFVSIATLAVNVYFTVGILCKLMHFCFHLSIFASVLLLWIISIDRYLKVCHPLGRQFSTKWAVPIVLLVLIFSSAMSIFDFFIYDSVPIELKGYLQNNSRTLATTQEANNGTNNKSNNTVILFGQCCMSTVNSEFQYAVQIVTIQDVFVIILVLVTFVIAYGNISHTLLKSSKRRTRCIDTIRQDPRLDSYLITSFSPKPKPKRALALSRNSQSMPDILAASKKSTKSTNNHSSGWNKSSRVADRDTLIYMNKRKGKLTNANVTGMMAMVSLAFMLSFIPYFIITGNRAVSTTTENELSALHQLALRSPFLNSIINPIIFCIFNPRHRRFITRGFTVREETGNINP